MLTDYHVHLRSDDLDATATEHFTTENATRYREAASARGIGELGVSEHVYRFQQGLQLWRHPFWLEQARDDLESYCQFVREHTDMRLGIEIDFIPGAEDRIANLIDAHDFDYVIGSVHFIGERSLDMDAYTIWDGSRTAEAIYASYFELLGQAACSGLFDILAHPDLVKVWGDARPRPEGDLRGYYEPAVQRIAESDVAVEVSTAGLRKGAGELYPSPALLRMCVEAGAPISLSSDAHRHQDVGAGYEDAIELIAGVGVDELCVFERRARRLEPIGAVCA